MRLQSGNGIGFFVYRNRFNLRYFRGRQETISVFIEIVRNILSEVGIPEICAVDWNITIR